VVNSKGGVTSVSSSVSATNYMAFDALGRMTAGNQITDGQTYAMSYAYNLAGGLTSMTYPTGRVIKTEYDAAGRMAGVRDQSSGIYYAGAIGTDATNRVQYSAHGAVAVMKLGNGLWEHTTFNNRLQPTQIGLGTSSTDSSTLGLTNTYGTTANNGNLLSVAYAGGGLSYTQTFGYDDLNRLTTSQEGASWSQTNKYDRYGNRWIDLGGSNQSLDFNTSNRITNSGYVYDAAGNLTSDGVLSYAFDAENKIKTVNGETDVYRYDGDGNRVKKNFTNGEKVRMVYSGGQLIAEYDLSNGSLKKEYVYGAKGLIATIEPTAGTRYTTTDHLGTPRVVTSSSAGIVSRHDYKPFGEELGAGIGSRTTGIGFSVADGLRQKFTSKARDYETGLDYFLARHYSSTQGRFTSPDEFKGGSDELYLLGTGEQQRQALPYAEISQPGSLNKYSYVYNNPLRFVDSDGHCGTPSGLKPGQVGICVASYIKTKLFPPWIGPGRGDGRGANGQGGTARLEVRLAVDVSKGAVTKTDEAMGRSGLIIKGVGIQGSGGSRVSEPNKDNQGNVYFQINQHGDSAMNVGGAFGTIDNHLNMVVTPDNKVGITPSSTAKDYPSLEVFKYTVDAKGNVTTTQVFVKEESKPSALKNPEQPVRVDPK
jgi:RHS repeat-associated protein